jgi:murein DD-endopeptidase MepM/ murein hydrolase activator NlpD
VFLLVLSFICLFCACAPVDYPPPVAPNTQSASMPQLRAHEQYITTPGRAFYHKVKYNETLWQIAKQYNITAQSILDLNNLTSPRQIMPGQSLLIPKSQYSQGLESLRTTGTFIWPVSGRIISQFGANVNGLANDGLNIRTEAGEAVKAANDGEVVFADYLKGWGQTIILRHPDNYYTVYANLNNVSTYEGCRVKKGDHMAQVALNTGRDPVLHFEIRKNYEPGNPLKYLK